MRVHISTNLQQHGALSLTLYHTHTHTLHAWSHRHTHTHTPKMASRAITFITQRVSAMHHFRWAFRSLPLSTSTPEKCKWKLFAEQISRSEMNNASLFFYYSLFFCFVLCVFTGPHHTCWVSSCATMMIAQMTAGWWSSTTCKWPCLISFLRGKKVICAIYQDVGVTVSRYHCWAFTSLQIMDGFYTRKTHRAGPLQTKGSRGKTNQKKSHTKTKTTPWQLQWRTNLSSSHYRFQRCSFAYTSTCFTYFALPKNQLLDL